MPLPSDRRRETIVEPLASSRTSDTGGSAAEVITTGTKRGASLRSLPFLFGVQLLRAAVGDLGLA